MKKKMTRKIYVIMHERPYVNVFNARTTGQTDRPDFRGPKSNKNWRTKLLKANLNADMGYSSMMRTSGRERTPGRSAMFELIVYLLRRLY